MLRCSFSDLLLLSECYPPFSQQWCHSPLCQEPTRHSLSHTTVHVYAPHAYLHTQSATLTPQHSHSQPQPQPQPQPHSHNHNHTTNTTIHTHTTHTTTLSLTQPQPQTQPLTPPFTLTPPQPQTHTSTHTTPPLTQQQPPHHHSHSCHLNQHCSFVTIFLFHLNKHLTPSEPFPSRRWDPSAYTRMPVVPPHRTCCQTQVALHDRPLAIAFPIVGCSEVPRASSLCSTVLCELIESPSAR